ncbi:MAG: GMC family oxidoreductase N-terminal domain-containing protein, partial [Myxococcales bacterium]|nr:GMC family oxidoreductase N-terminal domain-containing protein [Myxococcales bacterium]
MIYNHEHLAGKTTIDAEICVIGSGAGGGPVAYTAAKAGRRVVVIEAGSFLRPREMTQLENEMFPQLYHDKGGRTTTDQAVHVHQGKGVGGSTLHNLNLCERVPDGVLAHWAELGGGPTLQKSALDALYHEAETLLSVTQMGEIDLNPNNRMFRDGVVKLGYRGSFLRHNRKGCAASGFCELGCPFDAKQNSLKVFIAPAVREGLMVLCDTWALRATRSGRRLTTLEAIVRHPVSGAPIGEVRV